MLFHSPDAQGLKGAPGLWLAEGREKPPKLLWGWWWLGGNTPPAPPSYGPASSPDLSQSLEGGRGASIPTPNPLRLVCWKGVLQLERSAAILSWK